MHGCENCRCGLCCGGWPIVATDEDARRQPLILDCSRNGQGQHLLNQPGGPCRFLQKDKTGLAHCGIYSTRPEVCRRFDCQGVQGRLIRENQGRFYYDSEE
jgi:Fe-S-cluster containining protein